MCKMKLLLVIAKVAGEVGKDSQSGKYLAK
jgi:hypothetical protein